MTRRGRRLRRASRITSGTTSATSSSTSTRTSTRCRSDSSAAWRSSARTCASSATTTRRSTSGAAARSRTSSRSPTGTPASGRSTLDDNFRSSEGVVEVGRSVAERIPAGERLPKAMVAAGHQTWERGDLLALDVRRPGRGGGVDLSTASSTMRGVPFRDTADSQSRAVCRGRTSPCCSGRSRRTPSPLVAETAAPRHPVRRQGPEPALRQPGDPGGRRHLPLHGQRDRRAGSCKALWDDADADPDRC